MKNCWVFVALVLLAAWQLQGAEATVKQCRAGQKALVSQESFLSIQQKYHQFFLSDCLAQAVKAIEDGGAAEKLVGCGVTSKFLSAQTTQAAELYVQECSTLKAHADIQANSHVLVENEKDQVLLSVSWVQCISSACSEDLDLPYIAATQKRDQDFGAAVVPASLLKEGLRVSYVDGVKFTSQRKQDPVDTLPPPYGNSSLPYGNSSEPYGNSSSSSEYGYSSSSSSSEPYGYSSSSSSDSYGYSSSSSSDPYGSSSSSSSSDPYGYSSSSSSSDPYGYSSSSSSSDPYGYSSSSSSSDPYGYSSSSSSSDPYGYSSSSSSSDPYGYSSSSSSSDPYGYSSSSSDPYGYSSSSSSSDGYSDSTRTPPNGWSSSSSYGYSEEPETHHDNKHHKEHKDKDHKKHPEEPAEAESVNAFGLLLTGMGILFVFLVLVILAIFALTLHRRRQATTASSSRFAFVMDPRSASKVV